MYSKLPNLVLGFHGCDKKIFDKVILKGEKINSSENNYDWLGHGQYFWEHNYERAMEWAIENSKNRNSKIKEPSVVGAVIDLGHCLNMFDALYIKRVKSAYKMFEKDCLDAGISKEHFPKNKNIGSNTDLLLRNLDCAVIQYLHLDTKKDEKEIPFDSVRGAFIEGDEIYPGSGFREKTHIQICIINPNCIKGYFNPFIKPHDGYRIP